LSPKLSDPALVVWFTGLPGSGKTTIARGVFEKTIHSFDNRSDGEKIALVEMDSIRKKIFPNPTYSDEERDAAYRAFAMIGSLLSSNGVATLLDGVAHKRIWRELAREECPKFVEVYVKCPIEICIQRETGRSGDKIREKLYRDALERLNSGKRIVGLGKVPGVDEFYEDSVSPEIVIDSSTESPETLINQTLKALSKFDPQLFYIGIHN
jgi:adenylylsulfate kinase-like enzyme